jgi:futalosine hydrolase
LPKILLIAATHFEIEPLISLCKNCEVLITGIGIAASMYSIQKKLMQASYTMAIQAGIAGEYRTTVPLSQTYFVQKDCFADSGIYYHEKFTSLADAGLQNPNEIPYTNQWLLNPHTYTNLQKVNAATVQAINTNPQYIQALQQKWNAQIETLEGAAMHYVCLQNNTPFIQIRSTSNYVGERNKANWKIKEALENLHIHVAEIINNL